MQNQKESPPCSAQHPDINDPNEEPFLVSPKVLQCGVLGPLAAMCEAGARGLEVSPGVRLCTQNVPVACWAVNPAALDLRLFSPHPCFCSGSQLPTKMPAFPEMFQSV